MSAFGFMHMSPTIRAAHKVNSTTAPSLVHFAALKLVLHLPGLDNTVHSILKSYLNGTLSNDIQAISTALTGIGVGAVLNVPDIPSHPAPPLKRCSSPSPHSIVLWTKLFGNSVPALPSLTPLSSPTEPVVITKPESGSEILLFDDGGALVYHVPEPGATSSPVEPAPYLTRSTAMISINSLFESSGSPNRTNITRPARHMSFIPMAPIMESFEPSDPQDDPSYTSDGDVPDPEGSVLLQDTDDGDSAESVGSSADDSSYSSLSDVDSKDSHLPRTHLETACGTVDLGLPISSGDHIDSLRLRRVLPRIGNDDDVEVQPRIMLGKQRICYFWSARARSIFSR